jgi:hypothetical protein
VVKLFQELNRKKIAKRWQSKIVFPDVVTDKHAGLVVTDEFIDEIKEFICSFRYWKWKKDWRFGM